MPATSPEPTTPRVDPPTLTAADGAVIDRVSALARTAVDELRPRMLAGAGRSRRQDKRDGSPVTDVDHVVDDHLVGAIADSFPDHDVISEEGHTTWNGAAWTWIVDPIDGTTNYAAGLPWWCVSIALAHRGRVVWGLIDAPPLDRRWEARRGAGSTVNGQPVQVGAAPDLSARSSRHEPIGVTPGTVRRWRRGTFFKPRIIGSAALEMALVAEGSLTACHHRVPKVWDVAAGLVLVEEAGGAVVADGPGHFPLVPDRDYGDDSVVTTTGPNEGWTKDLARRLRPRD